MIVRKGKGICLLLFASSLWVPLLNAEDRPRFEEFRPTPTTSPSPPSPATTPSSRSLLPEIRLEPIQTPPPPATSPLITPPSQPPPSSPLNLPGSVPTPQSGISLDQDFQRELDKLNQELNQLKTRVIEMKSRLLSYSERVAHGFAMGTQLFVDLENKLGEDLRIEEVAVYIDGHEVYRQKFDLDNQPTKLSAFRGVVLPGRHRIDLVATLRGDEGFFDTSYSARLKLESGEYLFANEGKVLEVKLTPYDKGGGWFTKIEERPGLKFEITERDAF
jgi:hypothetical protein